MGPLFAMAECDFSHMPPPIEYKLDIFIDTILQVSFQRTPASWGMAGMVASPLRESKLYCFVRTRCRRYGVGVEGEGVLRLFWARNSGILSDNLLGWLDLVELVMWIFVNSSCL
jgi:hypothetical protein